MNKVTIHQTAEVSEKSEIGENSTIGSNCILGKNVYIDINVIIGNNVKIQNNVSVYDGVIIEDGVQVGPHACFTNDKFPRAINPDGQLKGGSDWEIDKTIVKYGASIGAHSVIVCGITVGKFALVGAGSVVTKNVPGHALVYGNPAKIQGYVCLCGHKLKPSQSKDSLGYCEICKKDLTNR